jgi:hypothetical protein
MKGSKMKALALFLLLCSVANAQTGRELVTARAMQRAAIRRYQIATWQPEIWWWGPQIYFFPTYPNRFQNLQYYTLDQTTGGWSGTYYQGRVYQR